jgi:hypothetical protein
MYYLCRECHLPLTLILLITNNWWAPFSGRKLPMGLNSVFEGLIHEEESSPYYFIQMTSEQQSTANMQQEPGASETCK